jgi:hypothetical protein
LLSKGGNKDRKDKFGWGVIPVILLAVGKDAYCRINRVGAIYLFLGGGAGGSSWHNFTILAVVGGLGFFDAVVQVAHDVACNSDRKCWTTSKFRSTEL